MATDVTTNQENLLEFISDSELLKFIYDLECMQSTQKQIAEIVKSNPELANDAVIQEKLRNVDDSIKNFRSMLMLAVAIEDMKNSSE